MEIGEPVKEVPGLGDGRASKYAPLMEAARNGVPDWVPVTFTDEAAAMRCGASSKWLRDLGYEVHRRRNVVYVHYLDGAKPE